MSTTGKGATITVRLRPGAKSNEILALNDTVLSIKVAAAPHRGQANRALLSLLAETLAVPKSHVDIIRGHTHRHKVIVIHDLTPQELKERLAQAISHKEQSRG